jgi:hypothetical protein
MNTNTGTARCAHCLQPLSGQALWMQGGVYHPHCAQDLLYPKLTETRVREIVREEIERIESERNRRSAGLGPRL